MKSIIYDLLQLLSFSQLIVRISEKALRIINNA
jgi:hypothetical protein